MTHGDSLFALVTRQLIETIGFVVRIFSGAPFYVTDVC